MGSEMCIRDSREMGADPAGKPTLGIDREELLRVDLNHVVEKYTSRIPEISRTAVEAVSYTHLTLPTSDLV